MGAEPTILHKYLAGIPELPLIVDTWYDDTTARALAEAGRSWGQIQGMSHPQSLGEWVRYFGSDNEPSDAAAAEAWNTVLYKPMGAVTPAGNYLVSDSDYVEVLTEIDIQSPIPAVVQNLRAGRNFLFLGCRFDGEIGRTFARQIIKRSSDQHWAVLPGELTKNEQKFLDTYKITPSTSPWPKPWRCSRRRRARRQSITRRGAASRSSLDRSRFAVTRP